jgi:hypothetical protein
LIAFSWLVPHRWLINCRTPLNKPCKIWQVQIAQPSEIGIKKLGLSQHSVSSREPQDASGPLSIDLANDIIDIRACLQCTSPGFVHVADSSAAISTTMDRDLS